jgi:hypothetical protein
MAAGLARSAAPAGVAARRPDARIAGDAALPAATSDDGQDSPRPEAIGTARHQSDNPRISPGFQASGIVAVVRIAGRGSAHSQTHPPPAVLRNAAARPATGGDQSLDAAMQTARKRPKPAKEQMLRGHFVSRFMVNFKTILRKQEPNLPQVAVGSSKILQIIVRIVSR